MYTLRRRLDHRFFKKIGRDGPITCPEFIDAKKFVTRVDATKYNERILAPYAYEVFPPEGIR